MTIETIKRNFSQGPNISKGLVKIAHEITRNSINSTSAKQEAYELIPLAKKPQNHHKDSSISPK